MVAEDDEMSKDTEIDKLMALISPSFKKIYKPTNNNLRTSSNTSRANQDNSPRISRGTRYDNQRIVNVAGARETVEMDQPNPTFAKILILDTGISEQWKFRIQQYLQNEHYALWEVIEFGDSYKAPPEETGKGPVSKSSAKKNGRTTVITTEDMQKRRNDVKARTTLLFALPDEHQLRFSKYEIAKELWESILKTFGGNEATKKTKKNQLKQQYGNFKAEGSETLEQTFNRLQAIVSHLGFMDVEIEKDDLNQKFLTSLAPEWLMYTIVWRNRDDLDTMSLDDVYNHLKVYKLEVQKNIQVSTTSTDIAAASLSHATICAYIATQSNGSQIKYEDITQIDEDDIEEIDIKLNMALLSMWADRFWKKTGKKITIQGSDVADLDNLLGSQRSDKNKEGLGYNAVPHPAQVYSPPKKDLSWTCLPEFVDDTFLSTARIETTNQETKILATVDGKPRTISESSLRRHLKLNDEEGVSSLPDAELFENLSLMGYNILPNQRFTFQKGQFSHQWK
nr:hypothetical protein [Tanacetum cinerariifolium]